MTTLTDTSTQAVREPFVQKYPLSTFFVLAIGLTWIFMITDALGSHDIIPFRLPLPLMLMMGYMPTLAAVVVTGLTDGKEGIRALFRKLLIARVGLGWYLFAIFGFAAVCVAAIELYNLFGGGPAMPILSEKLQHLGGWQLALSIVPMLVVLSLVNGEELAWRGFALPRLQAKYSALTSSLILGAIWTVFHLPLFFTLTGSSQADESFVSFLISTVSLTVLFTWMYNNTRGSVLMAYLFHGAINTWTRVLTIDHNGSAIVGWTMTGLIALAAVIVVATGGVENLSRSRARISE
jgi:membrane protease YdiL (CAAX protease family)